MLESQQIPNFYRYYCYLNVEKYQKTKNKRSDFGGFIDKLQLSYQEVRKPTKIIAKLTKMIITFKYYRGDIFLWRKK